MTPNITLSPVPRPPIAFDHAMVSARPALLRHALRLTKNYAAADDLVQDTFARAWSARDRFLIGTNMNAWLFRIARNAFLSGLRRTRRNVPWEPDRHEAILVQGATQEDALYARDLRAALFQLTPDQRDVLGLVMDEGMSLPDAASELGIAVGTVKSRIARARASLLSFVAEGNLGSKAQIGNQTHRDEDSVVEAVADEPVEPRPRRTRTRYEQWKASGATTIG